MRSSISFHKTAEKRAYQCLKLKFFSFFKAEILDATKGDIINALVTKLTNLMNEQRLNELAKLPMGSMEAMEAMEAEVIITVYM